MGVDANTLKNFPAKVASWQSPPAGMWTPSRDLTATEARDIVVHWVVTDQMSLTRDIALDKNGKFAFPKPTDQIAISPSVLCGVKFVMPNGAKYDPLPNVNLKFAVVLYWLANFLKDSWGATMIYAGGIGLGGDGKPGTDCHHTGRCIDFFGADTARGNFKVARDWSSKSFWLDGKLVSKWPHGPRKTFYRLDPDHIDPPGTRPIAAEFFESVYSFATRECEDLGGNKPPSKIGDAGFIIHPDYPGDAHWTDANKVVHGGLRDGHFDHIHFQVGAT